MIERAASAENRRPRRSAPPAMSGPSENSARAVGAHQVEPGKSGAVERDEGDAAEPAVGRQPRARETDRRRCRRRARFASPASSRPGCAGGLFRGIRRQRGEHGLVGAALGGPIIGPVGGPLLHHAARIGERGAADARRQKLNMVEELLSRRIGPRSRRCGRAGRGRAAGDRGSRAPCRRRWREPALRRARLIAAPVGRRDIRERRRSRRSRAPPKPRLPRAGGKTPRRRADLRGGISSKWSRPPRLVGESINH